MSSENGYANFNVQVKTEEISTGENSEMGRKNTVAGVNEIDQTGNLGNGDIPGGGELAVKTENLSSESLSNIKVEMSPTNSESGDAKCDTSTVDVENITNTLAEKVIIQNTEASNSSKVEDCDNKNIVTNKDNGVAEAAIIPEKLVNKVDKMNISGVDHHNESAVIVKQETESFKNLLAYDSSSDDDEAEIEENWQFRTINKSDTDSDDSVSSSDDDDSDEDEDDDIAE